MTQGNEEWGPWVKHDGAGRPFSSPIYVQTKEADGLIWEGVCEEGPCPKWRLNCWDWRDCHAKGRLNRRVIEYRIRKPRALTQLRDMVENMPAPSKQHENT